MSLKLVAHTTGLYVDKSRVRYALLVAIVMTFTVNALAAPNSEGWKQGQILVKHRAGLPAEQFRKILEGHGGRSIGLLKNLEIHKVEVPLNAEDAVINALSRNPHVKFAEKDMLLSVTEWIPNDPDYPNAWHLTKLEMPVAWEMATASNIIIAILDSGVDGSHPDLTGHIVPGWNVVSDSADTVDINGHGTMVAGAAAASTNNDIGVAAVGWNANIMPIRITNRSDGYAYVSDIANGLVWAANNGAQVANISFNVTPYASITTAAQYMKSKGGLVVAAAGNNASDPDWVDNASIIAVSATSSSDLKASFSNYGRYIDVAAPGVGIRTTTSGGGYGSPSGTSFSSPVTAGVIALIFSANPSLTPDEVEYILETSADDPVEGADWHAHYGHGRINAARAIETALYGGNIVLDNEPPSVTIFTVFSGDTISGLVAVDVNASDNTSVKHVALYVGGDLIEVDSSFPYQFDWDSSLTIDGETSLTAVAYDPAGNEGRSESIVVIIDNDELPTINISEPADGSTVSQKVLINVNGSDDILITSMELYIDGVLESSTTSDSLTFQWNSRKASDGFHTIKAEISDSGGNIVSQSIEVYIEATGNRGKKR